MIGYELKVLEALSQLMGVSVHKANSLLEMGVWMEHSFYEAGVVAGKWLVVYKDGELLHKVDYRKDVVC